MSSAECEFPHTFETFERNEEWFSKNAKKIETRYRNRFLAVLAPNEIVSDKNIESLIDKIKNNEKFESAFITAIPRKGVASIL